MSLNQVTRQQSAPSSASIGATGIAIASGKGGVGKTNVVANLAASLAMTGKKVLVLDADFGLSNLDVLLGLSPRYNVGHLLSGQKTLDEILVEGPAGMRILPAASGVQSLTVMTDAHRQVLFSRLNEVCGDVDFLLIDTSAGISENVTGILAAAARTIVITDPEPTSLVDAYALIKVMNRVEPTLALELLVNSVRAESEANEVYEQIRNTTQRFLSLSVNLFGWVVRDDVVRRAVRDQQLVVVRYPDSAVSESFRTLAEKLISEMPARQPERARILPFKLAETIDDGPR